jgi:hypothetical protein
MYNKFSRPNVSKLGREIIRAGGLTKIMEIGVMDAIPIWEMLGLSEDEYNDKYGVKPEPIEVKPELEPEPEPEPELEPIKATGEPEPEPKPELEPIKATGEPEPEPEPTETTGEPEPEPIEAK